MIAALALTGLALADPPRGEVVAGWAGNVDRGYAFVEAMPSLFHTTDASVVLALSASHLYYGYFDGSSEASVVSPGGSIGLGFVYAPGKVSFGLTTSFETRYTTRTIDGQDPVSEVQPTASLSSNIYWRPTRRTSLYFTGSFTGANAWLWARVGGLHQVIPAFRRDSAAALWLGLEATASGNSDTQILEAGAVGEVPIRDIHTSISVRGGVSVQDTGLGVIEQGTVGVGLYFWY